MQEHVAYWTALLERGIAVVFGPVLDPVGVWGVAIVEVENEADVARLRSEDPTIKANLNFRFEIIRMADQSIVRARNVH
jgi:hypothetical protein